MVRRRFAGLMVYKVWKWEFSASEWSERKALARPKSSLGQRGSSEFFRRVRYEPEQGHAARGPGSELQDRGPVRSCSDRGLRFQNLLFWVTTDGKMGNRRSETRKDRCRSERKARRSVGSSLVPGPSGDVFRIPGFSALGVVYSRDRLVQITRIRQREPRRESPRSIWEEYGDAARALAHDEVHNKVHALSHHVKAALDSTSIRHRFPKAAPVTAGLRSPRPLTNSAPAPMSGRRSMPASTRARATLATATAGPAPAPCSAQSCEWSDPFR